MVLPEGFVLPPLPVLALLLVGLGGIGVLLVRLHPPVTAVTVLALAPWMGLGGGLHAIDVLAVAPLSLQPFLAAPAVYLTTMLLAGIVWTVALYMENPLNHSAAVLLGGAGGIGIIVVTLSIGYIGATLGTLSLLWPFIALVSGILVTAGVWWLFHRTVPSAATATGWSGIVVLFAHILDGTSTLVGVDILGMGERTPLPLQIMELAALLPVADIIGVGWAFLMIKIIIASFVVWLFANFVQEEPRQAHLLLAAIAAVGLGPAVHNLLLFLVVG